MTRHDEQTSYEYNVVLMVDLLGIDEDLEIEERGKQWGGFIRIPSLPEVIIRGAL